MPTSGSDDVLVHWWTAAVAMLPLGMVAFLLYRALRDTMHHDMPRYVAVTCVGVCLFCVMEDNVVGWALALVYAIIGLICMGIYRSAYRRHRLERIRDAVRPQERP